MKAGQTYNLKVAFTPADTTQKQLKYVTSNSGVALVDKRGRIIGTAAGTATITVYSAADDKIFDKFYLTVTKEKVKITMCMSQIGWGGLSVDPDLMNETKSVIEDNTGTSITVISPPQSSYPDKLNVLLASGQYPDLFHVTKAMDNVQIYAARGYLMPLNDLLKATPEITTMVDEKYWDWMTVQGKISGIPLYVPQSKDIWVRKDAINKYGLKLSNTPTTEEFYTEMKKIVDKGVIPFCFPKFLDNLPVFTNPFGAYFGIGLKSGKAFDGFNTPEMKEALTYVAKLYKDKIFDQEFLTNENQTMREKLYTGKAASALDYTNRFIYYNSQSEIAGVPTDYFPIYTLKGPKGTSGNLNEAIQDALCISSKSKVPESALNIIKFYAYTQEGVTLRCTGVKGQHYNTDKNGVIAATTKAQNSGYVADLSAFYLYYPQITDFGFKWTPTQTKLVSKQQQYIDENKAYLGPRAFIEAGKSSLYDKNLAAYKLKIQELASKIIMGGSVDKVFEEYNSYWKSIKGDDMLAELNK